MGMEVGMVSSDEQGDAFVQIIGHWVEIVKAIDGRPVGDRYQVLQVNCVLLVTPNPLGRGLDANGKSLALVRDKHGYLGTTFLDFCKLVAGPTNLEGEEPAK